MKHLALFNGIGGFQLAAHWVGWKNVAHVEIDPFCNEVVARHFPESKCHTDIKEFNGKEYEGTIDIISGGFPCQPFSVAGKRKGKEDDRNLWPEMFRVIRQVRPAWVVGENVANLTNFMEFENALLDMESEGYQVQSFIIPAVSVGAWHKRERVWIVGNSTGEGLEERKTDKQQQSFQDVERGSINVPNTDLQRHLHGELKKRSAKTWIDAQRNVTAGSKSDTNSKEERLDRTNAERSTQAERWIMQPVERDWWAVEPGVGRVADGVPDRVDRLKSLGNAIVPQVAFEIFKAIDEI